MLDFLVKLLTFNSLYKRKSAYHIIIILTVDFLLQLVYFCVSKPIERKILQRSILVILY